MRSRLLPGALLLLLVAPSASAGVASQAVLLFDADDRYEMHLSLTYTGEEAQAYRASADRDGDGTVSPEEASRAKARLQASIEDPRASGHRLDDHAPSSVALSRLGEEGLQGPTDAANALDLSLVVAYTYRLNASASRTFQLPSLPETGTPARLELRAPHGWAWTAWQGLEAGQQEADAGASRHRVVTGNLTGNLTARMEGPRPPQPTPAPNASGQANASPATSDDASRLPPQPEPHPGQQLPAQRATPGPGALLALALVATLASVRRRGPPRQP